MVRTAKQRSSCIKLKKATLWCTTIRLNRLEKLRKWSNAMLGDLKVDKEGRMGVNRAALSYGVPRTTLKIGSLVESSMVLISVHNLT